MAIAFLEHTNGEHISELVKLESNEVTIGRLPDCDIVTESKFSSVSQHHCIISKTSGFWFITDVGTYGKGSSYGTHVNNVRLTPNEAYMLSPGDEIRLGTSLGEYFKFIGEGTIPVRELATLRGRLTIDIEKRQILLDGRILQIQLTPKEYDLFFILWQKSGIICQFNEICLQLWPENKTFDSRLIDSDLRIRINTLAHSLRKKISPVLDGLDIIESYRGIGYRLRL